MGLITKSKRLKKELTLIDVYAIATGTTLSAGFFLLPGLAAAEAGPAMVLSYLIAAIPMVPAMFCIVELATAMPRAGGAYYFLDRSMGPLVGTIGGLGTWLALVLKTTFALVGISVYLHLFFPEAPIKPIAIGFALAFGCLNLFGAKNSGRMQVVLVFSLLAILAWFIGHGMSYAGFQTIHGFYDAGPGSIFSTAGMVYISYVGVTKIASISEEVTNPERNLPLGVFMAFGTAVVVYGLGTYVMVSVVPESELAGNLTPVALAAEKLVGHWGAVAMSVAALLAFSSVANAGILSASRYPLAMSRDHLLPSFLRGLTKDGIPAISICITVASILVFLLTLDLVKIVKLASAFQLLVFSFLSLAVIVMRESRIESYDPGYRAPFYPLLQIFGFAAPLWLIHQMGWMPSLFSAGIVVVGTLWYMNYARDRIERQGAVYHVFERLGHGRFEGLDRELRSIMKEKGLREEDPFDEVIARAHAINFEEETNFEEIVQVASEVLAAHLPCTAEHVTDGILKGTKIGATPVSHGVALPHLRLPNIEKPQMVLVRVALGVEIEALDVFGKSQESERSYAIFFLISPEKDPSQHLRILAQIADQVDQDNFMTNWLNARDESRMKEALLREERFLSLSIIPGTLAGELDGHPLREISFPESCLVALIRREGRTLIPRGSTLLQLGDRLTIIGNDEGVEELRAEYGLT